jgi:ubiquinone/menaquinone biosynthesis C-methylase UbiE
MLMTTGTAAPFYDRYWPANLPNAARAAEHVIEMVPSGSYELALDGGAGTGVCSLALATLAERVIAADISIGSLRAARTLSEEQQVENITFMQSDLLRLEFPDNTFDLVWSWGVIHHTLNPRQALAELVRVLKPGGTLVLAVYRHTNLAWFHEAVRAACLRLPHPLASAVIHSVAGLVGAIDLVRERRPMRDDNPRISSKIEDWYFVPVKFFFRIDEMRELFAHHDLSWELVTPATGRFASTSNFICRGVKRG